MNTVRKIFLVIFILSTLGVLMLFLFPPRLMTPSPSVTQSPEAAPTASIGSPTTAEPSSENTNNMNFTALVGSVVTSVTSLIGFVTATVITWRKEKREASLADVERKKLETELEKSRLELEEMKKSKGKKKSKIL